MRSSSKLFVVAALGLICVACSNQHGTPPSPVAPGAPPQPIANPVPPVSAIPMHAPASGSSATLIVPPTSGPSLSEAMRRPSFQKSFAAVDGASSLPGWVKTGGIATPSMKVQVDGKTMWLTHTCETAGCRDGQLFLLIEPVAHTIQGLFVENSGSASASVQKFTWLGKPDAAVQVFLKGQMGRG